MQKNYREGGLEVGKKEEWTLCCLLNVFFRESAKHFGVGFA